MSPFRGIGRSVGNFIADTMGEDNLRKGYQRGSTLTEDPSGFDVVLGAFLQDKEESMNALRKERGVANYTPPVPGESAASLLSPEFLSEMAIAMGGQGANIQKSIEEEAPLLAPITDAIIPQSSGAVLSTPLTLGASLLKAPKAAAAIPSMIKKLDPAFEMAYPGMRRILGAAAPKAVAGSTQASINSPSDPSLDEAPVLDEEVLSQIAGEGEVTEDPLSTVDKMNALERPGTGITMDDIQALIESLPQGEERDRGNYFKRFFDHLNASYMGRNYDEVQAGLDAASQGPRERFQSQIMPELIKFMMEQEARAKRDMDVAEYENKLKANLFEALQ